MDMKIECVLIVEITAARMQRILFGTFITWPTPCHGLCSSPTYLNRSSSPGISRMSSLVFGNEK